MPPIELDVEVAHLQHALAGLAADGERFGQQHVERFAARDALTELVGLRAQLLVRVLFDRRFERIDRRNGLLILLDQPLVATAKNLLKETGGHRISVCVAVSAGRTLDAPEFGEPRRLKSMGEI